MNANNISVFCNDHELVHANTHARLTDFDHFGLMEREFYSWCAIIQMLSVLNLISGRYRMFYCNPGLRQKSARVVVRGCSDIDSDWLQTYKWEYK